MKLYAVRHGETNWNVEKKMQGLTDIELNETGIRQANELKEKIKDMKFDICLSSPLKRASKTASIIVDGKCQIILDNLLLERSLGDFEGQNSSTCDHVKYWNYNINLSENNVESMSELLQRAEKFIKKLKIEYSEYENVLIVSHAGFLKALYYTINGYDKNTNFLSFYIKNCELLEFDIK